MQAPITPICLEQCGLHQHLSGHQKRLLVQLHGPHHVQGRVGRALAPHAAGRLCMAFRRNDMHTPTLIGQSITHISFACYAGSDALLFKLSIRTDGGVKGSKP
jgi:hypothetical protein